MQACVKEGWKALRYVPKVVKHFILLRNLFNKPHFVRVAFLFKVQFNVNIYNAVRPISLFNIR